MNRRDIRSDDDFVDAGQQFEYPPEKQKKKSNKQYVFKEDDGKKYDPYAISKTKRIPVWLKVVFTKWWVPGMIFYFIYFGFGYTELLSGYILALVLGGAWGLVTDIFVNHAFRGFSSVGYNYKDYIIFGRERKIWTFPLNVLLGAAFGYIAVVEIITPVFGLIYEYRGAEAANNFMFFGGAFTFAFIVMGLDMAAVGIKRLILKLIKRKEPTV